MLAANWVVLLPGIQHYHLAFCWRHVIFKNSSMLYLVRICKNIVFIPRTIQEVIPFLTNLSFPGARQLANRKFHDNLYQNKCQLFLEVFMVSIMFPWQITTNSASNRQVHCRTRSACGGAMWRWHLDQRGHSGF